MLDSKKGQNGQVLLLVVLIMVVALTAGLSVASRSIIQVKTAKDESDSQRALSAAESGIEKVLESGLGVSNQSLGNNETISSATIQQVQSSQILLNNGNSVSQDDGADIWLSDYPTYQNQWTGTLKIYWGTCSGNCSDPAIEVMVLSGTTDNPIISRYGFDSVTNRRNVNKFSAPNDSAGNVNGQNFNNAAVITIRNPSPGLIARVIPLYANTLIGIAGYADRGEIIPETLPNQGKIITSTGASGQAVRKVSYFQSFESLPSELFYTVFSP